MFWERDVHETHRAFTLASGGIAHFRVVPPRGHWTIHWDSGRFPVALSGKYLSFESAYAAAENYLKNRKVPTEILEELTLDAP